VAALERREAPASIAAIKHCEDCRQRQAYGCGIQIWHTDVASLMGNPLTGASSNATCSAWCAAFFVAAQTRIKLHSSDAPSCVITRPFTQT